MADDGLDFDRWAPADDPVTSRMLRGLITELAGRVRPPAAEGRVVATVAAAAGVDPASFAAFSAWARAVARSRARHPAVRRG